jgi:hypothetical protein
VCKRCSRFFWPALIGPILTTIGGASAQTAVAMHVTAHRCTLSPTAYSCIDGISIVDAKNKLLLICHGAWSFTFAGNKTTGPAGECDKWPLLGIPGSVNTDKLVSTNPITQTEIQPAGDETAWFYDSANVVLYACPVMEGFTGQANSGDWRWPGPTCGALTIHAPP